eukprot:TRINITY_DN620_c2_g2_i1.p3 TRINITY_DN620_c2_g2~~TRINITY_DN620_c2_g2_i1.p3  ORF type:complete len:134 (-),score=46.21 TRINITY_DN620_c2_g2_i1:638-1039(-)
MSGFDALAAIGDEEDTEEMMAVFGDLVIEEPEKVERVTVASMASSSSTWSDIASKKVDRKRDDRDKGNRGGGGKQNGFPAGTSVSADKLRLVVACGIPGSGKSTVTKPLGSEIGWGRVNQDEMKNRKSCEVSV